MKIVQLLAGTDACEDAGHVLYGLSDDGSLYEFHYATEARKQQIGAGRAKMARTADEDDAPPKEPQYKFHDGSTQGWKLVCAPGVMAKPVPHPDDPTKCERC